MEDPGLFGGESSWGPDPHDLKRRGVDGRVVSGRAPTMKHLKFCAALAASSYLLLSSPAAQELTSGTLAGKVTDPAGRPIAGATVIVVSQFGTKIAETDAGGAYILPFLR